MNRPSIPLSTLTISVPHPVPLEDGEFIIKFRSRGGKLTTGLLRRAPERPLAERTAAERTKEERLAAFEEFVKSATGIVPPMTDDEVRDCIVDYISQKHLK